jgi:hypothetical protein
MLWQFDGNCLQDMLGWFHRAMYIMQGSYKKAGTPAMQLEHGGLSMLLQPSNANPHPLRACSRSSPQVCSKQPTSNWGQRLPSCHMHDLHAVFFCFTQMLC